MQGMYSMRSPAVKRLMKEAQELREPTEQYECHPLEDNLFEWHFTIRGPADSEFNGGLYHGRIILPPEYPMKPPSIIMLTPNGRFEINKKICLSISGHHPESWQPSWSLRTALLAIIGFMPTHGAGALGSLEYSPDERKILAKRSQEFKCSSCGCINNTLKPVTEESKKTTEEARELAAQIDFKDEKEKNAALKTAKEDVKTNGDASAADNNISDANTSNQPDPGRVPVFPNQQFGQFPFRFPFPPPYPQMNPQNANMATNSSPHVPRFPLPFVSPFYPPVMNSGNNPMFPMMPGMPMPPWQQNNLTAPTSTQNTAENLSTAQTTSVPQNTGTAPTASNTSETQTTSTNENQSEPGTTTPENIPGNQSTSTNSEGLRQRNVASTPRAATHHRVHQSTTTEPRDTTRADRCLLLFAVFVVVVLLMLLIRRLHIMKLISFSL